MEELDSDNVERREKRPSFLTVLCIISFVWLGLNALTGLGEITSGPSSEAQMKAGKVELAKSISE